MDHAVDFVVQADKQTEFGNVFDLAFNDGSDRVLFNISGPGVRRALFDAEADSSLFRINFKNFDFNFLRGRNDLAGVNVLAGPAHFGNVNQTFNAVFEFDERAVIGNVGNFAFVNVADFESFFNVLPRIALELFHAEADALVVFVEFDNLNLNRLSDRQNFGRVVDALPGNVGNVQQTVNAAEINERAVVGDVFDHAVKNRAFFDRIDQFGSRFCSGFFQNNAAGNNDVASDLVHFQNLEGLGNAHQRGDVADRTDVDLRTRQEGDGAV